MIFTHEIPLLARRAGYHGGRKARFAARRLVTHPVVRYFGSVEGALEACESAKEILHLPQPMLTTGLGPVDNLLTHGNFRWKR